VTELQSDWAKSNTLAPHLTTGPCVCCCVCSAVCVPGYGRATPAAPCTLCPAGTYQPGSSDTCQACPDTTFYPASNGVGEAWTSTGTTTYQGAAGVEACVPRQSQLSTGAGQAYFGNISGVARLATQIVAPTLAACLAACPLAGCCMAQYHAPSRNCTTFTLPPAGSTTVGWKLLYKLPPSSQGAAASVDKARADGVPSGFYARALIPDTAKAEWLRVGTNLATDARTITSAPQSALWYAGSEADCRNKCDSSDVCWGFIFDRSSCLFRAGQDEPHTRAFFVLPAGLDLSVYQWQGKAGTSSGTAALAALP
jgi:hypothetical protein